MPDSVEVSLDKLLKGVALDGEEAEICDFTLEEQNAALEAQGVTTNVDPNFKPICSETVTYVVAAVIFNEIGEVLMMQEAKKSCAGKWYLPAGRMQKNESISQATAREVLEETGLEIACTALLTVECAGGNWLRFVMNAIIVGGSLKTPAQADQESLQAKWIANLDELTLRAKDIISLIERAREYVLGRQKRDKTWHGDLLPAARPYNKILLRLVIVLKKRATNNVYVLLSEKTAWHFPTCEVHPYKSVHSTLKRFMVEMFGANVAPHRPHGLFCLEHKPSDGRDGVCMTLFVVFKPPIEDVPIIGKCVWYETTPGMGEKLMFKAALKNSTVPLTVIR